MCSSDLGPIYVPRTLPGAIPSPWCPKRSIVAVVLAASVMGLPYRARSFGKSPKTRGSKLLCGGAWRVLGANKAARLPVPELRIEPVALQQLLVAALLDDAPLIHNNNSIHFRQR